MGSTSNPLMASPGSGGGARPDAPAFVASHLEAVVMSPAPIHPDWIVSGNPVARAGPHSASVDGTATTAVWDCTAGQFNWTYGWEETVIILEGQVQVTSQDGTVRLLKAGDIAFFAAGTTAFWEIETHVRKLAFCRRELPPSIRQALRLRDRARDLARGGLNAVRSLARGVMSARTRPALGILLVLATALAGLIPEVVEARSRPAAAELQTSAAVTRPFSATTLAIGR
jgi:uncharacterized cupin superfamily protein